MGDVQYGVGTACEGCAGAAAWGHGQGARRGCRARGRDPCERSMRNPCERSMRNPCERSILMLSCPTSTGERRCFWARPRERRVCSRDRPGRRRARRPITRSTRAALARSIRVASILKKKIRDGAIMRHAQRSERNSTQNGCCLSAGPPATTLPGADGVGVMRGQSPIARPKREKPDRNSYLRNARHQVSPGFSRFLPLLSGSDFFVIVGHASRHVRLGG